MSLNGLLGNPMFMAGMGALQGQTPQAAPPNFAANVMGGLEGAAANRMTVNKAKREKERWEMEQEKFRLEKEALERNAQIMARLRQPTAAGLPQSQPSGAPPTGIGVLTQAALESGITPTPLPSIQPQMPKQQDPYTQNVQSRIAELDMLSQAAKDPVEYNAYQKEKMSLQSELNAPQDQSYRFLLNGSGQGGTEQGAFYPVFSTPDGSMMVNINGQQVPYSPEMGTPATPSQGMNWGNELLSADAFGKLETEYDNQVSSLQTLDRLAKYVNAGEEGIERIKADFTGKLRAFFNEGDLTPVELAQRLGESTTRQLIGQARIDLFGGGPLTESEADLAMKILLSDPTSFSKQQALIQLSDFYQQKVNKLNSIERQLQRQYVKRSYPFTPYDTSGLYINSLPGYFEQNPEMDVNSTVENF